MRIRELRRQRNYTQAELAKLLCVSRSTVAMWERNVRRPDYQILLKLCRIFDVTPTELLGGEESEEAGIPVLSCVKENAPIPVISDGDIIEHAAIETNEIKGRSYFGLRILGSSMAPRMREGDVVIVRRQHTAEDGDTVVVKVGKACATVKKIKYGLDGILLIPLNPECEIQCFTQKEIKTLPVVIVGKVVELRGKY